jgi:2-polyprenyl-3-methyl-5-hydroxy-6-metoxy-1,4-benzoquinol methylase
MTMLQSQAAVTRHEKLTNLWREVIDPEGIGMVEALANEIGSYTAEPVDVVRRRMELGTEEFKRLWEESHVDVSDERSVARFYQNQFVEAYELANWHAGQITNGQPPWGYPYAAALAQERELTRALDFGSGIGSGSLALASVCCEVHSADVAQELLKFVGHRMRRRGHAPHLIDLSAGEVPRTGYYDLITCFDVLEHIPDQLGKLRELQSYLRVGGYLFVNLMEDSADPSRPMHVSSAGDRLALVRKTAMSPEWERYFEGVYVLKRRRFGRLRNYLASWTDAPKRH